MQYLELKIWKITGCCMTWQIGELRLKANPTWVWYNTRSTCIHSSWITELFPTLTKKVLIKTSLCMLFVSNYHIQHNMKLWQAHYSCNVSINYMLPYNSAYAYLKVANWNENKINAKIMLVSISTICKPKQVFCGNTLKGKCIYMICDWFNLCL